MRTSAGTPRPSARPVDRGPDRAAAVRWQAARLLAAPHRTGFAAGVTMLSITSAWWFAALAAGAGPGGVHWSLPPRTAHATAMTFAFAPMFFAGFLFTVGPRWLALPPVAARALLPGCLAWIAGWMAFVAGAHTSAWLAAAGLAGAAAGWTLLVARLVRLVVASRAPDRTHLRAIAVACGIGSAALWLAVAGVATADDRAIDLALSIGRWWFLAPVFATAAHRMVPFFGVAAPCLDERHPDWLLWTWLALLAVQVPFDWPADATHESSPLRTIAAAVVDGAAAALAAWLAIRWYRTQNLRIRLLAMLHAGFVWFGIALALLATAAWLARSGGDAHGVRVAALHALGMGFFGTTLLAFVTRVSAAQHGRAHAIDAFVWILFLTLQAAVGLRIAAVWFSGLLVAAAALWALATLAWSARHLRWYGLPRADGRPA